jgi:hypothetical protein
MSAAVEDSGGKRRTPWIGRIGWAFVLLLIGFVVITQLLGNALTDRLTVHNRTSVPVEIVTDAFGSYPNYVGACSSAEFTWKQEGSKSGWTPAGVREWQGGAVDIEIPVERWFEARVPADHFTVVVTSEGVAEADAGTALPACGGMPPH